MEENKEKQTTLEKVEKFMDKMNKETGRSFATIDELNKKDDKEPNKKSKLEELIEKDNIHKDIEAEIKDFMEILYTTYLNPYPYNRRINLYRNGIIKIFNLYGYEIGSYFNNPKYRNKLHTFIKAGINKFEICHEYDLNELEGRINTFLVKTVSSNPEIEKIDTYYPNNKEKYNKYADILNDENTNFEDMDQFFIWSEKKTLELEEQFAPKNPNPSIKWVSRYDGDGYGFDILSCDYRNFKEKAIEVKSGKNDSFILTENEYNVMTNLKYNGISNYVDYYVYKYTYKENYKELNIKPTLKIYKYDYEKEMLINIEDETEYVEFYKTDYYDWEVEKIKTRYDGTIKTTQKTLKKDQF